MCQLNSEDCIDMSLDIMLIQEQGVFSGFYFHLLFRICNNLLNLF